eukprot:jgi/Ulvmu1/11874/UM081_0032.1
MFRRPFWRHWLRTRFGRALVSTSPLGGKGHKGSSPVSFSGFLVQKRRLFVLAIVVLLAFLSVYTAVPSAPADPLNEKCVEFIGTHNGSLQGIPTGVHSCDTQSRRGMQGYCVCSNNIAVSTMIQRCRGYDCACASLCEKAPRRVSVHIPDNSHCPAGAEPFFPAGQPHRANNAWRAQVAMGWWQDVMAKIVPSLPTVLPPGPRTENGADFVALGHRLRPEHRAQLRQQWRAFVHDWGEMPEDAFEGRGIAILSGNLPYLVPSVIALKAIRRTGCKLPVEFWFPANEAPTLGVAMKLHRLGATVRKFPVPTTLTHGAFFMKAIVVLLSSFKEVMMLDADQVPVADPTQLFDDSGFVETGALLWPDFWAATWAPDALEVLRVAEDDMPTKSFESGQMLFDKSRVWKALVLALHFNVHHWVYAPLFTNYMGMGDKETFAMALLALRLPYSLMPRPTGSLAYTRRQCGLTRCETRLLTNSMLQFSRDGSIAFVHANMPPKWFLGVQTDWHEGLRRWTVISPGPNATAEPFPALSQSLWGIDLERWVHGELLKLRCDVDMRQAALDHEAMLPPQLRRTPSLTSRRMQFKPLGLDLLEVYLEKGLEGDFLERTPPTRWQRWRHEWAKLWFGRPKLYFSFQTRTSQASTLGEVNS